jgi:hypothetical protein
LSVLIDVGFDLLRTIDEFCLRKVVNYRGSIVWAVAVGGDPPDQVISVRTYSFLLTNRFA